MEETVTKRIAGVEGAPQNTSPDSPNSGLLSRRNLLLAGTALATVSVAGTGAIERAQAQQQTASPGRKPNILMIMADDIGWFNVSAYNHGIMGYRTPNIDRIAKEGALFTDWY